MIRNFLLGLVLCLSLGLNINAEENPKKAFISIIPVATGPETSTYTVTGELAISDDSSIKIGYSHYSASGMGYHYDNTASVKGGDLSIARYNDTMFIGPYQRLGMRFTSINHSAELNEYVKGDRVSVSAKGIMPYALVGYNFGFFERVSFGGGIGLGYSLLEVTGYEKSVFVPNHGFGPVADINIGFLF